MANPSPQIRAPEPPPQRPWISTLPRIIDFVSRWIDRLGRPWNTLLLGAVGGLVLLALQFGQFSAPQYQLTEGNLAGRDIRVARDVLIEDPVATETARRLAHESVAPIYSLDPEISFLVLDKLYALMRYLAEVPSATKEDKLVGEIEEKFGFTFEPAFIRSLRYIAADDATVEQSLKALLSRLYQNWVVADYERLRNEHDSGIEIRYAAGEASPNEPVKVAVSSEEYDKFLGLNDVRKYLKTEAKTLLKDTHAWTRQQLVKVAAEAVRPNVVFNQAQTEKEARAAMEAVKPVLVQFVKGEVLVREGDRISAEQSQRLALLKASLDEKSSWRFGFGTVLFGALVYWLMLIFGGRIGWRIPRSSSDQIFVVFANSLLLLVLVASLPIVEGIHRGFPNLTTEILLLAFPAATVAMVARAVYMPRYTVFVALISAVLIGYVLGNPWVMYTIFSGGVVVAYRFRHIRRRSMFFTLGLQAGTMQALMAVAIFFIRETKSLDTLGAVAIASVLGGVSSAFFAMILLPGFEWLFNFTTDVKLAELGEDDQPLLRWLHIQAPGTYNHSVNVGRLAEVAAESIGADALLVKVGAYYHDIGKALMPQYFVENQKDFNPHEDLKPSMSALTIVSHVTKGREIAQEHRLPKPMIDFIMEHHGNSLVEYFYTKACDVADEEDQPAPNESRFRYPGPRPQTKESGILMLADVVEATSRVLPKPTEANIKGMIHRIVNKIFTDGQLDECPLTLQDLHAIAKSFSTVLTGMLHARITYPSKLDDPSAQRQTESKPGNPDEDSGNDDEPDDMDDTDSREGLKRIGIS